MAIAAVTPRVRTIVICDAVSSSRTEDRVFTLKRVRQQMEAASFPWRATLHVFLLLSNPRKGRYAGKILVVNERNDHVIRYANFVGVTRFSGGVSGGGGGRGGEPPENLVTPNFVAEFEEDNELLPMYVDINECVFPEVGHYNFAVFFTARDGEALKGEHPFTVRSPEE